MVDRNRARSADRVPMASRVILGAASALAPVLLFGSDLPHSYGWLLAGWAVCVAAAVGGYAFSFVTYALASWFVAAIVLAGSSVLETETSVRFADAAYMTTVLAILIECGKRAAVGLARRSE